MALRVSALLVLLVAVAQGFSAEVTTCDNYHDCAGAEATSLSSQIATVAPKLRRVQASQTVNGCVVDGVKNNAETDVDCGSAPGCNPCGLGLSCEGSDDCAMPLVCRAPDGVCTAPAIADIGYYAALTVDFIGVSKADTVTDLNAITTAIQSAVAAVFTPSDSVAAEDVWVTHLTEATDGSLAVSLRVRAQSEDHANNLSAALCDSMACGSFAAAVMSSHAALYAVIIPADVAAGPVSGNTAGEALTETQPRSRSASSHSVLAIAGGIGGGVGALAILAVIVFIAVKAGAARRSAKPLKYLPSLDAKGAGSAAQAGRPGSSGSTGSASRQPVHVRNAPNQYYAEGTVNNARYDIHPYSSPAAAAAAKASTTPYMVNPLLRVTRPPCLPRTVLGHSNAVKPSSLP